MIYDNFTQDYIQSDSESEYAVRFFINPDTGKIPVREYVEKLSTKDRAKVLKYIEVLRIYKGVLNEPYTRHVRGKLRELRVDFGRNRHRIFYFTFVGKEIILLSAFLKNTQKTPESEIIKAETNYLKLIKERTNNE